MGTALMRAAHTRLDPAPLIDDVWGDRLVPEVVRAGIRDAAVARLAAEARGPLPTPDAALDNALVSASAFANVILRARYTEDALQTCVANGTRQYVIIGAGFDSFALRQPPFARGVLVFEVDRPETQRLKRQRIVECGIATPTSLHFVGADLAADDLGALLACTPYRSTAPAFFSWLGVAMFLTREACLSTFQAVARCSARGSELVFTYFDEEIYRSPSDRFRNMQAYVQASGEPFQSGLNPARLAQELRGAGLELIEDLADQALIDLYGRSRDALMKPLPHSRIARARVP